MGTQYDAYEARRLIIAGTAPANLSVGGGLYLSGTGITALPEGLSVGGGLDLSGTGITHWGSLKIRGHEIAPPEVARERIAEVAKHALATPGALKMESWHCGTSHCIAGWGIHLAGNDGYALESMAGPALAGTVLLGPVAASHFSDTNEGGRAWLQAQLDAA